MSELYDQDDIELDRLVFARSVLIDIAQLNLDDQRAHIDNSPRWFRRNANARIAECEHIHHNLILDIDAIDAGIQKIARRDGWNV